MLLIYNNNAIKNTVTDNNNDVDKLFDFEEDGVGIVKATIDGK